MPAKGFGSWNRTLSYVKTAGLWLLSRYEPSEESLAAFLGSGTAKERSDLLEQNSDLITVDLVKALLEAARRRSRQGAHQKAKSYLEISLQLAEHLGDKKDAALALRGLGTTYESLGQYVEAHKYFGQWLKQAESGGDKDEIVRAVDRIGKVYFEQGRYDEALEHYHRA